MRRLTGIARRPSAASGSASASRRAARGREARRDRRALLGQPLPARRRGALSRRAVARDGRDGRRSSAWAPARSEAGCSSRADRRAPGPRRRDAACGRRRPRLRRHVLMRGCSWLLALLAAGTAGCSWLIGVSEDPVDVESPGASDAGDEDAPPSSAHRGTFRTGAVLEQEWQGFRRPRPSKGQHRRTLHSSPTMLHHGPTWRCRTSSKPS